jgi:hypothetical protein
MSISSVQSAFIEKNFYRTTIYFNYQKLRIKAMSGFMDIREKPLTARVSPNFRPTFSTGKKSFPQPLLDKTQIFVISCLFRSSATWLPCRCHPVSGHAPSRGGKKNGMPADTPHRPAPRTRKGNNQADSPALRPNCSMSEEKV